MMHLGKSNFDLSIYQELDVVIEELEKIAVVHLLQNRSIISLIGNVQRSSLILEKASAFHLSFMIVNTLECCRRNLQSWSMNLQFEEVWQKRTRVTRVLEMIMQCYVYNWYPLLHGRLSMFYEEMVSMSRWYRKGRPRYFSLMFDGDTAPVPRL